MAQIPVIPLTMVSYLSYRVVPQELSYDGGNEQANPVWVSVHKDDRSILSIIIDRTTNLHTVMKALRRALRPLVPYRPVDPRVFEAVRMIEAGEAKSYRHASIRLFGTPAKAEQIRYWRNKMAGR
jgi:hypothetical protein